MSKPLCTVMVGLPALGKSTFIQSMYKPETWIYSTDRFIEDAATHCGKTYEEMFVDNIEAATESMNALLEDAIKEQKDIIWDQTNLNVKKRQNIINRMKANDYNIRCICLMPPVTPQTFVEWKRRLDSRPGKTIPQHVLANMIETYVIPTIEEGFDMISFYNMHGALLGIDYDYGEKK